MTAVAVRSLSGMQKAALVLMNLSTERAAAVLRNFGEAEAEEITAEIARMRSFRGRDAEVAIREFQVASLAATSEPAARSGQQVATELIQASFAPDRAADLLERIESSSASASFAFLERMEPPAAVRLLADEAPETVAFVLVQLGPDQAAKILMLQEADRRTDVAQCLATMGSPAPEAGGVVAEALKRAARVPVGAVVEAPAGGDEPPPSVLRVQPLVDIMNHAEPAAEGQLLAALRDRDSQLADEVRAKLLSFEDLPRLQDRDLQQMLRGVDVPQLALALKGAPEAVAEAIRANMSERNRTALAEEAAELGRVPKKAVDEARNVLVRAVRELAGTQGLELKKAATEDGAPVDEEPEAVVVDEEEYVD